MYPIIWKHASSSDLKLLQDISQFLGPQKRLLPLIFHPSQPRLKSPPDCLLKRLRGLSSGELALVKAVLDLWTGEPIVSLRELFQLLPPDRVISFIQLLGAQFGYR